MSQCGGCTGSQGGCGGCARELVLTRQELEFLTQLGQIPFLPIARRADDPAPIYLGTEGGEDASLILQCLEKKGLVSLDYDKPLKGFDYGAHRLTGSAALTQRGQQVLELVEWQGIGKEI